MTPPVQTGAPKSPKAAKKRKNNPSRQKRIKARKEREAMAEKVIKLEVKPKSVCSNPRFHPQHCDCPVHEDVFALIGDGFVKGTAPKEKPLVTSFVFHDDRPAIKSVFEQDQEETGGRLTELVSEIVQSEKYESVVNSLREAQCEIGHLKSRIKTQEKMLDSLENQLKEARNVKRAKMDRRNRVRNRRASDKAFDMGVIGMGRDEWSIK